MEPSKEKFALDIVLNNKSDIGEIGQLNGLTHEEALKMMKDPVVKELIECAKLAAKERIRKRAVENIDIALDELVKLARQNDDNETARKAAIDILNYAQAVEIKTAGDNNTQVNVVVNNTKDLLSDYEKIK